MGFCLEAGILCSIFWKETQFGSSSSIIEYPMLILIVFLKIWKTPNNKYNVKINLRLIKYLKKNDSTETTISKFTIKFSFDNFLFAEEASMKTL